MRTFANSNHKAKALCIWGTASSVGKSLFTAGLGRLLSNRGYSVAPFKAQNMSNNSAVTEEGGEIGRAQACQAQACRIPVVNDLNPLLLKPTGDKHSQVVIHGRVRGRIGADFGQNRVEEFKQAIAESYDRLSTQYDVILIEGAGGCAELNLRHRDLANLWIAEYADAQVVLISDIDRGGIFAALLGTLDLLDPGERERVIGLVVNKFRGAINIFEEGQRILKQRSGKLVLGVLPYIRNHHLPDEDNASLEAREFDMKLSSKGCLLTGVIIPNHISNGDDLEPLIADPRFCVRILYDPSVKDDFDLIIIPGSKSVIEDLCDLKNRGFDRFLQSRFSHQKLILGICGGYQMLGKRISDPLRVESGIRECEGLGLLNVETELHSEKITKNVRGQWALETFEIIGYEIHCGQTTGRDTSSPLLQITEEQSHPCIRMDGAQSLNGRVWGTYIHGLFERREMRDYLCRFLGKNQTASLISRDPYDRIASEISCHLQLEPIFRAIRANISIRNQG